MSAGVSNYTQQALIAAVMKLQQEQPELFQQFRDSMQDPRQNHVIHEDEEITDL